MQPGTETTPSAVDRAQSPRHRTARFVAVAVAVAFAVAAVLWATSRDAFTVWIILGVVLALGASAAWFAFGAGAQQVIDWKDGAAARSPTARDSRSRTDLAAEIERMRRAQLELEANEVHFRALVETSGDIVWTVDASGCCTYVNGAALETILGYRAEEIIGMPLSQFADGPSGQAFDDAFFRLSEHGGRFEVESVFLHRYGHPVPDDHLFRRMR